MVDAPAAGRKSPIKRVLEWFGPHGDSKPPPEQVDVKIQRTSVCDPSRDLNYYAARRLPARLEETSFDLRGYDKVFSSAWISERLVLIGTKCQNLILLDILTGKKVLIPGTIPLWNNPPYNSNSYGIHAIACNPSKTLVAVGAGRHGDTTQFEIFLFAIPSFEPMGIFRGHSDLVFSFHWLDDETLISGSRDKSLKMWKIGNWESRRRIMTHNFISPLPIFLPRASQVQHEEKVRDLLVDRRRCQSFTLSSDGYVKIWSCSRMRVSVSIPLIHVSETVCLGHDQDHHLISVGSQAHISLLDPRAGQIVHVLESMDEGWGVRSMAIHNGLLSVGGGLGKLSFYDLRSQRYIQWQKENDTKSLNFLQSGKGWLYKGVVYQRHFHNLKVYNAIYSLMYDDSHGKLFIAGGPLQVNLKGSMAGIWQ